MTVEDLMSTGAVSVSPDESVTTASRLLSRHNIGSLPVVSSDGKLKGMVTDRDIVLRCVAADSDPSNTKVSEIMTRRLATVGPKADIRQAAEVMAKEQVRRLPITGEDNRLLGMLALGDLTKARGFDMEVSETLSDISENIRRR